jgi:hypothetical protein
MVRITSLLAEPLVTSQLLGPLFNLAALPAGAVSHSSKPIASVLLNYLFHLAQVMSFLLQLPTKLQR